MMNLGVIVTLRNAFSSEANRIINSYNSMANGITSLNGIIGNSMYQTWNGVSLMTKGVAMMLPAAFSVKEAATFEKQLAAIRTVWEYTNASTEVQAQKLVELRDKIQSMSSALGTDPIQTAAGMYTILQANITDTAEALHILELSQKSAIAGFTTTESASKALISLRNAYNLTGEQMDKTSDQIFQALAVGVMNFDEFSESLGKTIGIVRQAGLELSEYFALKATGTLSGMSASQVDSGIRQSLQELFQPKEKETVSMINQMKELGALSSNFEFSTKYMNEQAGSFHAFLEEIYNGAVKIQQMNVLKDKNGLSMTADKIMGRLFNDMEGLAFVLNVVGTQGEKYRDVLKQIEGSEGKLDSSYAIVAETLSHKWEALMSAVRNFMITAGTPLLGFLSKIVGGLTIVVNWVNTLFRRVPFLSYVVIGLVTALGLLFIAIGLSIAIIGFYNLAIVGLQATMLRAAVVSRLMMTSMLGTLRRIFPSMALLAGGSYILHQAWKNNWGGMRDTLTTFWDNTKLVGKGLWELISSTKNGLGSMSVETASALKKAGLFDFVVTVYMWWYRLKVFWDGFKVGFMDVVKQVKDGIKDMFESSNPVLKAIGDGIMWVLEKIGLLRPSEDSVDTWKRIGEAVGKVVAWFLIFVAVGRTLGMVVGIVRTILAPFKMLWSILRFVGQAAMFMGRMLGKIPWAMVQSALLGIARFAGVVWRAFEGVLIFLARVSGILFRFGGLVIRVIGWVIAGVAAVLGIPMWLAAIIVAAVVAIVAAVIMYWDEIKQFFIDLWDGIVDAFNRAGDWIQNRWDALGKWFSELPGRISKFFDALPGMIGKALIYALAFIITWLVAMAVSFGYYAAMAVDAMIKWFQELPGRVRQWFIQLAIDIAMWYVQWRADMQQRWNQFVEDLRQTAINLIAAMISWYLWMQDLPNKIQQWWSDMRARAVAQVIEWAIQAMQWAQQMVTDMQQWWDTLPERFQKWLDTTIENFTTWISDVGTYISNAPSEWWAAISGGLAEFASNVGSTISSAFSSAFNSLPGWAQKAINGVFNVSVSSSGNEKDGGSVAVGAATGGYIKSGAEGLTYLHPNELVINSPTYEKLKSFLNNVPSNADAPQLPMEQLKSFAESSAKKMIQNHPTFEDLKSAIPDPKPVDLQLDIPKPVPSKEELKFDIPEINPVQPELQVAVPEIAPVKQDVKFAIPDSKPVTDLKVPVPEPMPTPTNVEPQMGKVESFLKSLLPKKNIQQPQIVQKYEVYTSQDTTPVDNEPSYNVLKTFFDRFTTKKETHETEQTPQKEYTPVKSYTNELAESRERKAAPVQQNDDSKVQDMLAQMQQMIATMQMMATRPIQVTAPVVINGKEIARATNTYNREQEARKY